MGDWFGKDITVELTGIAHGGFAVGRFDGRVVFVSDGIPGEVVVARVSDDSKASFWRADTISIQKPSEHRVQNPWPEAGLDRDPAKRVGGADFGHIALPHQLELKKQVSREALGRFAKLPEEQVTLLLERVESLPGDVENNGLGWRSRVKLHVSENGTVGPRARRSHEVIKVDSLPLASDGINQIAPLDQNYLGIESISVLSPSTGEPRLIIGKQSPSVIRERVGSREFRVDDSGFWQIHRSAPLALSEAVKEAVDRELFDSTAYNLDLYGGVGLFAAALAEMGGTATRITSVEANERATEHAGENLSEWVGAFAETGRVEKWLQDLHRRATESERQRLQGATVILDPPRNGAGRDVINTLGALAPKQIVYVACDPVALSRDIEFSSRFGYRPVKIKAFDLFPHTHHVEMVCTLIRES